jgi:TonB family protein
MPRPRLRLPLFLLLAALAAGPAALLGQHPEPKGGPRLIPAGPEGANGASGRVLDWQRRLRTIDERLRAGDWAKAKKMSDAVLKELFDHVEGGPGAGPLLAMASMQRGLAQAGLGNRDDALWDWLAAQNLSRDFRGADLFAYGAPGAELGKVRLSDEGLIQGAPPARSPKDEGVIKPERLSGSNPGYPEALRKACKEGTVVVSTIIDDTGKVRSPVVLESPGGPLMAYSALEAVRTWRFKPATLLDQPIAVAYVLTVNYDIQGCKPR